MFDIFDKNVIRIPRGNTVAVCITPIDDISGNPIVLAEGDSVVLSVASRTGEKVITKRLTSANYDGEHEGALICEFGPSDTQNLLTGEYPYDCLLIMPGVQVTFITSSLIVTETIGGVTDE